MPHAANAKKTPPGTFQFGWDRVPKKQKIKTTHSNEHTLYSTECEFGSLKTWKINLFFPLSLKEFSPTIWHQAAVSQASLRSTSSPSGLQSDWGDRKSRTGTARLTVPQRLSLTYQSKSTLMSTISIMIT